MIKDYYMEKKRKEYEFTAEDMKKLYTMTANFEGKVLTVYSDSVGVLTVGIGHNIEANPVPGVKKIGDKITEEKCYELFEKDMGHAMFQVQQNIFWVRYLNPARQAVLYDMCFNLGINGLLKFRNTLTAIEEGIPSGSFNMGAKAMLNSKWAMQVGRRAVKLHEQMIAGDWVAI
jgi:lysozyme